MSGIFPAGTAGAALAIAAAAQATADGAQADATAALASLGDHWTDDLPEYPHDGATGDVYAEMVVLRAGLKIGAVKFLAPVLGSSAAGTYTADVTVNGTSVMTGTVNLETLVAGTWAAGVVKSDGTEDLSVDDEIRVTLSSSNADLTGYDGGIIFTVEMRDQ
jgi:hypothetical protein